MSRVIGKRVTARVNGDFVVFLIGMRINKAWKLHKESGFLGHISSPGVIVQYWRSFEQLEAYARDRDQSHWPAWVDFNTRVGTSREDVGIWHETYRIRAGEYECVYSGMPPFGLAKASATVDAVGSLDSARGRLDATPGAAAQQRRQAHTPKEQGCRSGTSSHQSNARAWMTSVPKST